MSMMGTDFRNRLKDALRPNLEQCSDCDRLYEPSALFEGLCERCSLEEAWWYGGHPEDDPRAEYTFVRDLAL